jgi:hypothetical protein
MRTKEVRWVSSALPGLLACELPCAYRHLVLKCLVANLCLALHQAVYARSSIHARGSG